MISFLVEQVWGSVPEWLQAIILILLILSYATGHLLANTKTPPPNTAWGRIYQGLEIFGNVYGKAKDIGIPVPAKPSVDDLLKQLAELRQQLSSPPPNPTPAPVPVATFPPALDQSNA